MKKLFLLLTFLSTIAFGQNKGLWKKYVDIPPASALTAPIILVPADADCCGPGIFNFTKVTNTPKHVKTSGNFVNGLSLRQWDGTAGTEYTIVNTAGDIYGGVGGSEEGVSRTNSGNYWRLYGLSATAPMIIKGNNGIQLPSATGGAVHVVRNAVVNTVSSGVTANFGISGTAYYENVDISFIRDLNNTGQGELVYIGDTGGSYNGTNYINVANVYHNFSYNLSRECNQFEHINLLSAHNNTGVLSGQTGGGGQDNSLQAHDLGVGSRIYYNIYDTSPSPFNIFTHGTRIDHNFFSFTATISGGGYVYSGYIGRTDNSYFSASPRLSGDSLIFEYNYFKYKGAGTLDYLVQVNERVAHIIFRNCTFSANITHIMRDNRAVSYTNTLTGDIGDHGNVSATIADPVYVSGYNDANNYQAQGLLSMSSIYYTLHFGYRSP